MNLQLAYYLGAAEVYLLGFDHNYTKPKPQDIVSGTVDTSKTDDENHFDPRYFGAGYRWHDPKVKRMERSYLTAKKMFEQNGRAIFNATAGGSFEVFPRVEYASIFN